MLKYYLPLMLCILHSFYCSAINTNGNYRTKSSGNFSNVSVWQVRSGGVWVNASSVPGVSDTFAIQSGHTITLTQNQDVGHLFLSSTGVLACENFNFNIWGGIRCYNGAASIDASDATINLSGTPSNGNITCNGSGRIRIVGSTRSLTFTGAWGANGLTTSATVEFAMDEGQTVTLNTGFKARTVIITSGTVYMNAFRLSVDGGAENTGELYINGGTLLSDASGTTGSVQVVSRSGTGVTRCSLVYIGAAGTLQLTGGTPCIDANSFICLGTVDYARSGTPQSFLRRTSFDELATLNFNYQHVIVRGSGNKSLVNRCTINGTLDIQNGLTLNTLDSLVLNNTARIDNLTDNGGGFINGRVTYKSQIPSGVRRFRFLSIPVQSATLEQLIDDIFITGNGGAVNGFDPSPSNNASAFRYTESMSGAADLGWNSYGSISQSIESGRGIRVLVRGDRSDLGRLNGTIANQNAVEIDVFGNIHRGDVTPTFLTYTNQSGAANDGWNLVGNPYMSAVDWQQMYSSGNVANINPTIYYRNAATGAYVSYNAASNSGTGSRYIGIMQAFFVQFNGVPSFQFKENFKSSQSGVNYFKKSDDPELHIVMQYDSNYADELMLKLNAHSTPAYNQNEDALKWSNEHFNLYSYTNTGDKLSLDISNKGSGDKVFNFAASII